MKASEILNGNILIDQFMGATISQDYNKIEGEQDGLGFYFKKEDAPGTTLRYSSNGILYHSDWNWLMSVVLKMTAMYKEYSEYNNTFPPYSHLYMEANPIFAFSTTEIDTNITKESLWQECVDFIKWYNTQSK